ncbi:MAG: sulfotransferase domain-containing protein [Planctomycetaceae bacterium]|nr:sulfotransferase domain-containing protein [Planctomycetaceae bacterium]
MITKRDIQQSPITTSRCASPDFFLHIGMPKTGTTTLQYCLFSKHSQVNYLGKYNLNKAPKRPAATQLFYKFGKNPYQPTNDESKALLKLVTETREMGQTSMYSREGLCALPEFHRERVSTFVKNTFLAPRVLLTIREPLSFVESLYFQHLNGYQFGRRKIVEEVLGVPPRYFDINQWFDIESKSKVKQKNAPLLRQLKFGETALHYARVLGKENVKIMVFEQLKSNSDEYYRELCDFMQIDLEEAKQLAKDRIKNFRWTEEPINRIKQYERSSAIRRWYFRQQGKEWRNNALGINKISENSQRATANISPEIKQKILDLTRSQCQIIESEFNIPLKAYGYTVD